MTAFKVGDQVRIKKDADTYPWLEWARGVETTIIGRGACGCEWTLALISPLTGCHIGAQSCALEPLTPPQADADSWAADKVREVTTPRYEPIRAKEPA